jgi:hypothetical protein
MAMSAGGEYDLVIRLRPDKPIKYLGYDWDDIREICSASPVLFADSAEGANYANPMIGDQFAIGALEPMRIYSTTWTRYRPFAANELLKCGKAFEGHVSLAQVCWLHGIRVKKAPIRFGILQEPGRLSSRRILHCLEEDTIGRMNRSDCRLLEAAAGDLKG